MVGYHVAMDDIEKQAEVAEMMDDKDMFVWVLHQSLSYWHLFERVSLLKYGTLCMQKPACGYLMIL